MIRLLATTGPVLVLASGCLFGPCALWCLVEHLILRLRARRVRPPVDVHAAGKFSLDGIPRDDQAAFNLALLRLEGELARAGWQHERQDKGEGTPA